MDKEIKLNFSSGIPALDEILQGVLPGDNVIFKIDRLENYIPFVNAFCNYVNKENLDLIYLRFNNHQYLLPKNIKATVYELNPKKGFDYFISDIIKIIDKHGVGACYVFDSLSDLAVNWYSNVMLGNFFMLICPYLYKLKTVAYFGLFRNYHDSKTLKDIQNTAQVIIDVYQDGENSLYVHPVKVFERFSSKIFMLHKWSDLNNPLSSFQTIKSSTRIANIISKKHFISLNPIQDHIDAWNLTFQEAQKTLEGIVLGQISVKELNAFKSKILRKAIVQDEFQLNLALKYFDLDDILDIRKRMIGTGFIGGKSLGMLLSRAIVKKEIPELEQKLEVQDSFFLGTDIFYTYLVKNDCWWLRRKLSNPETFLEGLEETCDKMQSGTFPDYLIEKFIEMLDYFGQAPIIVRSSSLQEDSYADSFSGKAVSIFLTNQGTLDERLKEFLKAIRTVYTSSISPNTLCYRKNRLLLDKDEQMAILVQRVSGSIYGKYFFPHIAGTGYSFNPYVWNERIDPNAGFLRLVFGLGTRATSRTDDDFPRLVALNEPSLRVESTLDEIQRYSQKKVDLLDIEKNKFITKNFLDFQSIKDSLPMHIFATYDYELEKRMQQLGREFIFPWVLTFNHLLEKTDFTKNMIRILNALKMAYKCPVDIEFAVNFFDDQNYNINLLQCRPFQVKDQIKDIPEPKDIENKSIIFQTSGPIIGNSIATKIDRIIYIEPEVFSKMTIQERYSIARLIGKINQLSEKSDKKIMLIGAGRWGTSTPSYGVPVSFAEINNISIICEIREKMGHLTPDVSLGTHFFNDLVECDMLYFIIYPEKERYSINRNYFRKAKNSLTKLIPESEQWSQAIKVIDLDTNGSIIHIYMNAFKQDGIGYLTNE